MYPFCLLFLVEFEDRQGLKVHMAEAHMINTIDCSRCHKSFMGMEALKIHMKNEHYQCQDCGYISSTLQGLSKHKSSHKQCEHCKIYFNGKHGVRLFQAHVKRCGNRFQGQKYGFSGLPHKCNVCHDVFPAKSKLKRHQASKKCQRRSNYEQELETKRVHIKQERDKKEDEFSNSVLPNIISNLQQAQDVISKDPKFERGLKMKKFLKIVLKTYNKAGRRTEMAEQQTVAAAQELVTLAAAPVEQTTENNIVMQGVHFMTKD